MVALTVGPSKPSLSQIPSRNAKNTLILLDLMASFFHFPGRSCVQDSMVDDIQVCSARQGSYRGLAEIALRSQSRSGFVRDLGLGKSLEILDLMGLFLHILIHRARDPPKTTIGVPLRDAIDTMIAQVDRAEEVLPGDACDAGR